MPGTAPNRTPEFRKLAEGMISVRAPDTPTACAMGPRCVVTEGNGIVCTFMVQSASGINDFKPMLTRSSDGGTTWSEEQFIWPHLTDDWSLFGSISRAADGELFFYGSRCRIDEPGEPNWCDATQGLKENELFRASSMDEGKTWSEPIVIPMPIPGAAEVPGPMCITRNGEWHVCYAPYNTFDPELQVDRSQIVHLWSADRGASWQHNSMMRFSHEYATGAEAWIVELADGRLLGTCWNMNQRNGSDFPNAYAVSKDHGRSWAPTRPTGIMGQSTALTPLADGRALFLYNQRKHPPIGVWMAVVQPTEDDFGVQTNELVWTAAQAPTPSATGHSQWIDYAFGEPSAVVLPDGSVLVVLWRRTDAGNGITYVRMRID